MMPHKIINGIFQCCPFTFRHSKPSHFLLRMPAVQFLSGSQFRPILSHLTLSTGRSTDPVVPLPSQILPGLSEDRSGVVESGQSPIHTVHGSFEKWACLPLPHTS